MKKEVCKLCNKEYSRLATHLKMTHKIEPVDYYKKYDREKYLQELEQEIINKFYISYRKEYIVMNKNRQISTVHSTLTDRQVKQHIRQRNRLGIKFGQSSNLMGLDIDVLDIDVLENIYNILLNYGIPDNAILKSFSGNKGYHIDIFLDSFLDRETINKFYKIILNDTGYKSNVVELRGGSSEGYFLPFSINYKGIDNQHWGYCGIVNKFGIMYYDVEKEIEILEGLGKADTSIIRDIVDINYNYIDDDIVPDDPVNIEKEIDGIELLDIYNTCNTDVVEQIGNRKVIQASTRHNLAFVYAIALREIGLGEQEVHKQLISWHKQVKGYSSTWKEVEQDCNSIVKSVFKKQGLGYKYNLPSNYKAYITKQDIEKFAAIENIAQRRIYLALTIHSNTYATYADEDGQFYMTYKQIKQALGINTMNSVILNYIQALEGLGLVEIVARDRIEEGQNKHKPNIYRVIKEVQEVQEQDIYYLSNNRITKQEVEKAIEQLFTTREFRNLFRNKTSMRKVLSCLSA